jgi:hypothetical protein
VIKHQRGVFFSLSLSLSRSSSSPTSLIQKFARVPKNTNPFQDKESKSNNDSKLTHLLLKKIGPLFHSKKPKLTQFLSELSFNLLIASSTMGCLKLCRKGGEI